MGSFLWLFKRRKKMDEKKLKILKEDEIESFLKKELEKEIKPLKVNFESFRDEVERKVAELNEALLLLEQSKIDIPDTKTKLVVESKRKEFVGKIKKMIKTFKTPSSDSPEDIIDYYESCMHAWTYANSVAMKDFIQIKDFFESESKNFFKKFKSLFKTLESGNEMISKEKSRIEEIKEALQTYKDFIWLKKTIQDKENELVKIKQKIMELSNKKSALLNEISNLEDSEELKRMKELEKEKSAMEYRQREIASTVVEIFSSFDRALKKFYKKLQMTGDQLEKDVKKCLESPFDALISGINVGRILTKLEEGIANKKIDVKSREKLIKRIHKLVEQRVLDNMKKEYEELERKIEEVAKEIKKININSKREKLNYNLKEVNDKIVLEGKKLKEMNKKLNELNDMLEAMKEEVKKSLSRATNKEIRIVFN